MSSPELTEERSQAVRARQNSAPARDRAENLERDALIARYLPLARRVARRYHSASAPLDDLVQVASLALVKAVDRFDPDRGVAFSSYAVPTMVGEIKRFFRDSGWAVHVPRSLQEQALGVGNATRELTGRLGRSPTVAEVAQECDLSVEHALAALQAADAHDAASLDAPAGTPGEPSGTMGDSVGAEEPGYELVEYSMAAADAVRRLPPRDREVIRLRFVEDLTQTQIAERVGVSQMQVSRILRRSLERLREDAGGTSEAAPTPA